MKKTSNLTLKIICVISTIFTTLCIGMSAYAVPAEPSHKELCLNDGRVITVYNCGDEYFNWIEDEDGNVITYNSQDGKWYYAGEDGDSNSSENEIVSNNQSSMFLNNTAYKDLLPLRDSIDSTSLNIPNAEKEFGAVTRATSQVSANSPKINQELLVLLIEFDDVQLKKSDEYWGDQYFLGNKSVVHIIPE